jgi:hypothetical protein
LEPFFPKHLVTRQYLFVIPIENFTRLRQIYSTTSGRRRQKLLREFVFELANLLTDRRLNDEVPRRVGASTSTVSP